MTKTADLTLNAARKIRDIRNHKLVSTNDQEGVVWKMSKQLSGGGGSIRAQGKLLIMPRMFTSDAL